MDQRGSPSGSSQTGSQGATGPWMAYRATAPHRDRGVVAHGSFLTCLQHLGPWPTPEARYLIWVLPMRGRDQSPGPPKVCTRQRR